MELRGMQKVHIVPVGFEKERITEPLKEIGADKVILIRSKKNEDSKNDKFYEDLITENKEKIEQDITDNVKILDWDFWNLTQILNKLCTLVYTEKEAENIVFINVSSGNKLFSVAGTIAGMMYNAKIYYAKTENRGQYDIKKTLTKGPYTIEEIPHYTILPPKDDVIKALSIVEKNPNIKQYDFIVELESLGVIEKVFEEDQEDYEKKSSKQRKRTITKNAYGIFRRNFLTPLKEQRYIEVEGSGKKMRISITPIGKNTLNVFKTIALPEEE